jgi:endogenous inhibitor of DNA gyrase (YacG/DUF329 family)
MVVSCPSCGVDVEWSEKATHRPFCSKKCQLIDLGEWADEEKSIPCQPGQNEMHSLDVEDIEALLSEQSSQFFTKD